MITNAKYKEAAPVMSNLQKQELPRIEFLRKDGSLQEEPFKLSEYNAFVSTENDYLAYGKIEHYKDGTRYFLKEFRGGRIGEYLPDPYGFMTKETDLSTLNEQRGGRYCEYTRVKPVLFEGYKEYLQTRNERHFQWVLQQFLSGEGRPSA